MSRAVSKRASANASKASQKKSRPSRAKSSSKLDVEQLLNFYREMLLIRRFEERAGQMYGMGLIGAFCH